MTSLIPFSQLLLKNKNSKATAIVFYEKRISWNELHLSVMKTAKAIDTKASNYLLFCEEPYHFIIGMFALIACNKSFTITSNLQENQLTNIASHVDAILTDKALTLAHTRIDTLISSSIQKNATLNTVSNPILSLTLFTSGSTGTPTPIVKPFGFYEKEVDTLNQMWGNAEQIDMALSSVPHYHAYGLVFGILLPLSKQIPVYAERIKYPEQLLSCLKKWRSIFISSPAFLKRWADVIEEQAPPKNTITDIFSAGGELPTQAAEKITNKLMYPVREIYGSTETGAIATRSFPTHNWQPLPNVSVEISTTTQQLCVLSPFSVSTKKFITNDKATQYPNGTFTLEGRVGNIVKIEEKRISTQEIVDCCSKLPYFNEIHIFPLQANNKEILGAVSTLNQEGINKLETIGRRLFVNEIKKHLSHFIEAIFVPRKWRFIEEIPRNEMGKTLHSELVGLFETKQ